MNDLDLVEKFRADVAPADPAALSRARARMFHDPAPRHHRWIWGLVPAGALAVAVVVAVVAGGIPHPADTTVSPKQSTAPAPLPSAPPSANDAAGVLRLAAAEVRTEPVLTPGPGQFLYVESIEADDDVKNLETRPTWVPPRELRRDIWLSVDGSKPGLLIQTEVKTGKKYDVPLDADGTKAYLTTLPTDPVAMRAWLYKRSRGNENSPDSVAWDKIGDTLRERYVPPAVRATLFEAAATIPGTTLVKQADLAGRKGVAVSLRSGPTRFDYIFDAKTYEFLGERVVVVGHLPPYPKGAVSRWTAQLRMAVVDRAGQRP
jgi:hypothetical protein